MSSSLRPHGLYPTKLICPQNFLGKDTGVGCHFLLQGIYLTQGLNPVSSSISITWELVRTENLPCTLSPDLLRTCLIRGSPGDSCGHPCWGRAAPAVSHKFLAWLFVWSHSLSAVSEERLSDKSIAPKVFLITTQPNMEI